MSPENASALPDPGAQAVVEPPPLHPRFPLTVGLYSMLRHGAAEASLYSLVITGTLLSVVPVIALFLALQRYWRIDLVSGAVR